MNQKSERRQFIANEQKRYLLKEYVRSSPDYQKITQEGQYFWGHVFLSYLEYLDTVVTLKQMMVKKEDEPYLSNLEKALASSQPQLLDALIQFAIARGKIKGFNVEKEPVKEIKSEEHDDKK